MRVFDLGTRDGSDVVSDRIITIPNLLSLVRLLALPLIYVDLVQGRLVRAVVIGFVFGSTDWLDGYLARRLRQVTRFGQLLDPIADRLLIIVVGLGMVVAEIIPLWAVIVLLVRDAAVLVAGLVLLRRGRRPPAVTRIGKAATFGLMASFPMFILAAAFGDGSAEPLGWLRGLAWFTYVANTLLYYAAAGQYAVALARTPPAPPDGRPPGADHPGPVEERSR